MGLEEGAQPSGSKRMEVARLKGVWKRQAKTVEGKKISVQLQWWILIYRRIGLDLRKSKDSEQDLRDKLERIENVARRNNLRMLNIPEGQEGDYIKMFCASLIKKSLQFEESEREIAADIQRVQRVHRDPFRRDPARKKPQKILINFLTYALKEKILL
ncbi:hypothetical protein NDU88_003909 [Pleurodeles waltl]|uniref:Uncharacterized protein n=1 Tax=Pleurodeles waltl TaxID=8319 RepID=A0AAV7REG7_PLEWA|nr:hypothetical protein NDU88_003909 [Pleurodeles waltl]